MKMGRSDVMDCKISQGGDGMRKTSMIMLALVLFVFASCCLWNIFIVDREAWLV